ncbi:helix-turn-helix domain-containing protein [Streptomyces sp. NPDC006259]|uniref:helix-turn-helix domain-containing protein n=1 Tax=Streptomyces sp. NPDC006259 TaxID=3364740 RepID=UPI0036A44358
MGEVWGRIPVSLYVTEEVLGAAPGGVGGVKLRCCSSASRGRVVGLTSGGCPFRGSSVLSDPGVKVQRHQRGMAWAHVECTGIHEERLEETLGRAVREWRGRTGMTQVQLAELSGLTQAAISRLEHGKCMPTFALLERIARAFDSALLVSMEPGRGVTVTFAGGGDGA